MVLKNYPWNFDDMPNCMLSENLSVNHVCKDSVYIYSLNWVNLINHATMKITFSSSISAILLICSLNFWERWIIMYTCISLYTVLLTCYRTILVCPCGTFEVCDCNTGISHT